MAPLVLPLFVDCCFKRWTKPLLPMVPLLSSRPPSLVGCFRCPPPLTLAPSHGRRHQQSVALTAGTSTSPSPSPGPPVVVAMPPLGMTPTFVCASSLSLSSSWWWFPPLTAVKGVLPASRLPAQHDNAPWKIVDLHNINSSGVMAVHLFLFSFDFNSYVCFYVGSVWTVLLSCSCDVLEPVTEEQ